MLDKEFSFYLAHQNELLAKYENQYIAIVGDKVVGAYRFVNKSVIAQSYEEHLLKASGTRPIILNRINDL